MELGKIYKSPKKITLNGQEFDIYPYAYITKSMILISEDQNTAIHGCMELDFHPVKSFSDRCRKCFLHRSITGVRCFNGNQQIVPCYAGMRKDKRNGYFSIRQVPETGGEE